MSRVRSDPPGGLCSTTATPPVPVPTPTSSGVHCMAAVLDAISSTRLQLKSYAHHCLSLRVLGRRLRGSRGWRSLVRFEFVPPQQGQQGPGGLRGGVSPEASDLGEQHAAMHGLWAPLHVIS